MSNVDLNAKIPNNVDLGEDKKLQRALEQWQPNFLEWWKEMGPEGFQANDVYLRTAISVDADGWAHFDYVKMPDYRWGIFLADADAGPHDRLRRPHGPAGVAARCPASTATRCAASSSPRATPSPRASSSSACSATRARQPLRPAQPLPGERRGGPPPLGDGLPAPQLLRPRRPRGGRGAARSAAAATPTSRASSARSTSRSTTGSPSSCSRCSPTATASTSCSRSPRSASTRSRAPRASCSPRRRTTCSSARPASSASSQRTAELMKQDPNGDARAQGGIDLLDMIQSYLNLWYSLSLDLFGGEISQQRGVASSRRASRAAPRRSSYADHTALDEHLRAWRCSKDGRAGRGGRAAAQRDERGAARRLRRGLPARRRPLEQAPRGGGPRRSACACPSSASTATSASTPDLPFDPEGRLLDREEWDAQRGRVAAHRRRPRLRRDPAEAA